MRIWLMITSVAVFAAVQCAPARAQMVCNIDRPCIYSVKFLCGVQSPSNLSLPSEPPVKPANYATAINIHNFYDQPITLSKSVVIATPESVLRAQVPSQPKPVPLNPGQAIEIDCSDIVSLLLSSTPPVMPPPFIKGFVELRGTPTSALPILSVTAVYTAQAIPAPREPPQGPVSIEVVPVQPFNVR